MMETIILVFIFLFGIVIGSFLNVLIFRYNTGWSIGGRSKCLVCAKTLAWYELIPILSFFFSFGKCRGCKSKISIQYPLVELSTGLLFITFFEWPTAGAPFYVFLLSNLIIWAIWSTLVFIFVYDLRHKIIPNEAVALFAFLAIGFDLISSLAKNYGFVSIIPSIFSGFVFFLLFFILWFFSGGKWIGFGDAKLALGIGFYLGFASGLSALAFSFWIGAITSLAILIWQKILQSFVFRLSSISKPLTMKSEIPFAPFLIIGTFLSAVLGSDIFGIHTFF